MLELTLNELTVIPLYLDVKSFTFLLFGIIVSFHDHRKWNFRCHILSSFMLS